MRGAPRVGFSGHYPEDQCSKVRRQFFPTDSFSCLGDPTPVQSKTGAMPANHSFRSDHEERLLPFRPEAAFEHPEEPVKRQECWPCLPAFSTASSDEAP